MKKPNAHLRLSGKQWQLTKRVSGSKRRLVVNLHTDSLVEARKRRDEILAELVLAKRTNDEQASDWRQELRGDGVDAELVTELITAWAENLEPSVGTEEAVRLSRTALGQVTPIAEYLVTPSRKNARVRCLRGLRGVRRYCLSRSSRYRK
jgi:hypothetical protein